jgi:hypothetical protein
MLLCSRDKREELASVGAWNEIKSLLVSLFQVWSVFFDLPGNMRLSTLGESNELKTRSSVPVQHFSQSRP